MGSCCLCAMAFKIALGILNTVIMLVGLLLAGLGGVLLGLASNMAIPLILQGIIFTILSTLNVVDQATLNNVSSQNLADLMIPAGTALVIVGGFIACVGALGYFGLSFNIMMKVYSIVLGVLILFETIGVALFFSGVFNTEIRKAVNSSLVNHYIDINDAGIYSMIWNVIMIDVECCGMDNYQDFYYTNHPYPKNDTIKDDNGQLVTVLLQTPLPCCKTNGSYPKIQFVDDYCAVTPSNNISNWETGCWNKVYSILTQPPVIAICSLIIVAQGAIAAMAGIIIRESRNSVNPV